MRSARRRPGPAGCAGSRRSRTGHTSASAGRHERRHMPTAAASAAAGRRAHRRGQLGPARASAVHAD
eukprot:895729-Prymnesium_polylepis.1